jgi:aspartyl/glutamyl-tRNA(Asn/Gln) amidotransferase C subunit
MEIKEETLHRLSRLAMLEIDEISKTLLELQGILDFLSKIKELNPSTGNVRPASPPSKDEVVNGCDEAEGIRRNFPSTSGDYLKVPLNR